MLSGKQEIWRQCCTAVFSFISSGDEYECICDFLENLVHRLWACVTVWSDDITGFMLS